nr:adhesion G-protein coupled receptor G2 isoform X2 [Nothobranchius furzeri]
MLCRVFCWILLCFLHTGCSQRCASSNPTSSSCLRTCPHCNTTKGACITRCKNKVTCYMEDTENNLTNGTDEFKVQAFSKLQSQLENMNVTETTFVSFKNIKAILFKPTGDFSGLEINANDNEALPGSNVSNRKVSVFLPGELLGAGQNNTIVFYMILLPAAFSLADSGELYSSRLIGLSVTGKEISGLQERVNITLSTATSLNMTQKPQCVFLNTTVQAFKTDGCLTVWEPGQDYVTCSCDHLTYFGVLLVSVSEGNVSPKDQEVLSYITMIGCSISLFALVITVFIFITNRKLRADNCKKIHISLAVALILLNLHFLPSQAVAAGSSTQFCFYVAFGLHYSLLATFSWMALEGLHLYLLLVKVFNIYISRYLLKVSMVGWGVPAVIVSVVIINRDCYGHTPLDESNPNGTAICYIINEKVKWMTLGVFNVVFLFNVTMFWVTAKWFLCSHVNKKVGQNKHYEAKRELVTLLTLTVLLGITWGLIFFSFGTLTTPGLYVFCILNSLQGFFILIYFLLSLKKTKDFAVKPSSVTRTTTTKT